MINCQMGPLCSPMRKLGLHKHTASSRPARKSVSRKPARKVASKSAKRSGSKRRRK